MRTSLAENVVNIGRGMKCLARPSLPTMYYEGGVSKFVVAATDQSKGTYRVRRDGGAVLYTRCQLEREQGRRKVEDARLCPWLRLSEREQGKRWFADLGEKQDALTTPGETLWAWLERGFIPARGWAGYRVWVLEHVQTFYGPSEEGSPDPGTTPGPPVPWGEAQARIDGGDG